MATYPDLLVETFEDFSIPSELPLNGAAEFTLKVFNSAVNAAVDVTDDFYFTLRLVPTNDINQNYIFEYYWLAGCDSSWEIPSDTKVEKTFDFSFEYSYDQYAVIGNTTLPSLGVYDIYVDVNKDLKGNRLIIESSFENNQLHVGTLKLIEPTENGNPHPGYDQCHTPNNDEEGPPPPPPPNCKIPDDLPDGDEGVAGGDGGGPCWGLDCDGEDCWTKGETWTFYIQYGGSWLSAGYNPFGLIDGDGACITLITDPIPCLDCGDDDEEEPPPSVEESPSPSDSDCSCWCMYTWCPITIQSKTGVRVKGGLRCLASNAECDSPEHPFDTQHNADRHWLTQAGLASPDYPCSECSAKCIPCKKTNGNIPGSPSTTSSLRWWCQEQVCTGAYYGVRKRKKSALPADIPDGIRHYPTKQDVPDCNQECGKKGEAETKEGGAISNASRWWCKVEECPEEGYFPGVSMKIVSTTPPDGTQTYRLKSEVPHCDAECEPLGEKEPGVATSPSSTRKICKCFERNLFIGICIRSGCLDVPPNYKVTDPLNERFMTKNDCAEGKCHFPWEPPFAKIGDPSNGDVTAVESGIRKRCWCEKEECPPNKVSSGDKSACRYPIWSSTRPGDTYDLLGTLNEQECRDKGISCDPLGAMSLLGEIDEPKYFCIYEMATCITGGHTHTYRKKFLNCLKGASTLVAKVASMDNIEVVDSCDSCPKEDECIGGPNIATSPITPVLEKWSDSATVKTVKHWVCTRNPDTRRNECVSEDVRWDDPDIVSEEECKATCDSRTVSYGESTLRNSATKKIVKHWVCKLNPETRRKECVSVDVPGGTTGIVSQLKCEATCIFSTSTTSKTKATVDSSATEKTVKHWGCTFNPETRRKECVSVNLPWYTPGIVSEEECKATCIFSRSTTSKTESTLNNSVTGRTVKHWVCTLNSETRRKECVSVNVPWDYPDIVSEEECKATCDSGTVSYGSTGSLVSGSLKSFRSWKCVKLNPQFPGQCFEQITSKPVLGNYNSAAECLEICNQKEDPPSSAVTGLPPGGPFKAPPIPLPTGGGIEIFYYCATLADGTKMCIGVSPGPVPEGSKSYNDLASCESECGEGSPGGKGDPEAKGKCWCVQQLTSCPEGHKSSTGSLPCCIEFIYSDVAPPNAIGPAIGGDSQSDCNSKACKCEVENTIDPPFTQATSPGSDFARCICSYPYPCPPGTVKTPSDGTLCQSVSWEIRRGPGNYDVLGATTKEACLSLTPSTCEEEEESGPSIAVTGHATRDAFENIELLTFANQNVGDFCDGWTCIEGTCTYVKRADCKKLFKGLSHCITYCGAPNNKKVQAPLPRLGITYSNPRDFYVEHKPTKRLSVSSDKRKDTLCEGWKCGERYGTFISEKIVLPCVDIGVTPFVYSSQEQSDIHCPFLFGERVIQYQNNLKVNEGGQADPPYKYINSKYLK